MIWDFHWITHCFGLDSKTRSEEIHVKGAGSLHLRNSMPVGSEQPCALRLGTHFFVFWSTQSTVLHLSGDSGYHSKYRLPPWDLNSLSTTATDMALEHSRLVPGPSLSTVQGLGCHHAHMGVAPSAFPSWSFFLPPSSLLIHYIWSLSTMKPC